MTLSAGTRLGPYEILSLLGAGGMGEVYRARDTRLGREAAVKVLPAALARDKDRLSRFESEARAASALNHPNIVTIYDVGEADGVAWIGMELVEGETLRDLMGQGAVTARRAAALAAQIADGLARAHEAGIVHRDLKPGNILVSKQGRAKILDFGLARVVDSDALASSQAPTAAERTQPGTVLGTVGYMSPEQVRGQAADPRTDIFALRSGALRDAGRAQSLPGLDAGGRDDGDPAGRSLRIFPRAPRRLSRGSRSAAWRRARRNAFNPAATLRSRSNLSRALPELNRPWRWRPARIGAGTGCLFSSARPQLSSWPGSCARRSRRARALRPCLGRSGWPAARAGSSELSCRPTASGSLISPTRGDPQTCSSSSWRAGRPSTSQPGRD